MANNELFRFQQTLGFNSLEFVSLVGNGFSSEEDLSNLWKLPKLLQVLIWGNPIRQAGLQILLVPKCDSAESTALANNGNVVFSTTAPSLQKKSTITIDINKIPVIQEFTARPKQDPKRFI